MAAKTKLIVMCNPKHELLVRYAKLTNRIVIDGTPVDFTSEAEHVGVIRSIHGNMQNILNRIASYKKALASVGCAGLSRSKRVNPAASLRIHTLYAVPVLYSGLASLVLKASEMNIIAHHYKAIVQQLQRLHEKTPRSVVYLLGGCLPPEAILHMRQLSLFSMICRIPNDPLNKHGKYVLTHCKRSCKSWFFQILDLCDKYGFSHPLSYLEMPPNKLQFRNLVKTQVVSYWHYELIQECKGLKSLKYFRPELYSLTKPHYMWSNTGGKPYETSKATVQARMLSGRFRSEMFCRHFNSKNREGYCTASSCNNIPGTLEHILLTCPSLNSTREQMYSMCLENTVMFPTLHQLIIDVLASSEETKTQFFLEPLSFQHVQQESESIGPQYIQTVSYITRTFVFRIYREYSLRFK